STVTPPSLPMLKLSRSPGSTPRWSRISFGIVIWPLDVSVAVGMSLPIASVLTLFLTPSRQRRRSLRTRVESVRGARVRAAHLPAAGEAHLDTVIRGIDVRGALERGAVGVRGEQFHRGQFRGAARGAEHDDHDDAAREADGPRP